MNEATKFLVIIASSDLAYSTTSDGVIYDSRDAAEDAAWAKARRLQRNTNLGIYNRIQVGCDDGYDLILPGHSAATVSVLIVRIESAA